MKTLMSLVKKSVKKQKPPRRDRGLKRALWNLARFLGRKKVVKK